MWSEPSSSVAGSWVESIRERVSVALELYCEGSECELYLETLEDSLHIVLSLDVIIQMNQDY